jgi:hypothetical protein
MRPLCRNPTREHGPTRRRKPAQISEDEQREIPGLDQSLAPAPAQRPGPRTLAPDRTRCPVPPRHLPTSTPACTTAPPLNSPAWSALAILTHVILSVTTANEPPTRQQANPLNPQRYSPSPREDPQTRPPPNPHPELVPLATSPPSHRPTESLPATSSQRKLTSQCVAVVLSQEHFNLALW